MLEIKIQCDCGQKYKFDVEPVHGRMPFPVKCPICGVDGTEKANAILREQLASAPPAPAMAAPQPAGLRIGQSSAAAAPPPSPPPMPSQPALRISGSASASAAPSAPAPLAAPSALRIGTSAAAGAPPPIAPRPLTGVASPAAAAQPAAKGNFALGIVGAVAGGVIGMLVWYFICKSTGMRLGILALGVGALTGYGSKLLGRCPTNAMGLVAAGCAFLCILGTNILRAHAMWHVDQKVIDEAYDEEMTEAKKVVADVPNGTDDEIRHYLLKQMATEGERPDASQITADEIKIFHDITWQKSKDFADGKTTRESYRKDREKLEDQVSSTLVARIIFWVMALGIFNIFYTIAAVGLAYKIGIGADDLRRTKRA